MLLQDLFDDLAGGEFAQMGLVLTPGQPIDSQYHETLTGFAHLALLDLCARFNLLSGTLMLELTDGISNYRIHKKYTESDPDSAEPVRYIKDAASQYQSDFNRVEQVFVLNSDSEWEEVAINRPDKERYVSVSPYDTLTFVGEFTETSVKVRYRAKHPPMDISAGAENIEIRIPEQFRNALLYFIAARQLGSLNTTGGESQDSVSYRVNYEAEVRKLMLLNPVEQESHGNLRLERGGWE